jgi:glutathione synthase/RimK-type ligase-like ATP-grasp enzyme
MKIRLVSTNLVSNSLKRIAEELSAAVGYKVYRSSEPRSNRINLLYGVGCDKITQYKYFAENNIPALPFTSAHEVCKAWIADGKTVVARTLTNASEGRGIILIDSIEKLVHAPVYTQYVPKKREFRVHVFKDKVVHILEKKKRNGSETLCTKVRNLANGWVFCSEIQNIPEGIEELALKARAVTKSDFVGVDIGYNEKKNFLFVIECNSAPGIEGTNVTRYVETIIENV